MSGALPFVRVVVLNWNAAWLTTRCVRSLLASTYPPDRFEIVVVDNASTDGSLPRLRHDLGSEVRFVANEANLGFAEGNNRAIRDLGAGPHGLTPCDHIALVNNDAVVDPGWLEPLVAQLTDSTVGAVAPKMLLEMPFSPVRVTRSGVVERVEAGGVDVTRRCVYEGSIERAHPTLPLVVRYEVRAGSVVHVPVDADRREVTIVWDDGTGATTVRLDPRRDRRINSLGTQLTPWTEGFERWFGEIDRPNLAPHETWGFSGGGVLLRGEMLRQVGVFDPNWFAYYEDTDLAWRARRRGWRTVCAPESVVHHLHGGSAGPEARGFFFLNYRNWLLTVLRNGRPRQVVTAARTAAHLSWGPFRRNVFGPVRRGRRPDLALTAGWLRVFAGVGGGAPGVLLSRLRRRRLPPGDAHHVRPRLMPATPARAPRPRPAGPLLVYIDVTETLRSGWRAGIQRVVCELVRELPPTRPDLQVVLVTWSPVHQQFRLVDTDEYERLLSPTAAQQPSAPLPPPSRARRVLAQVMHRSGSARFVDRYRRARELRAVPSHHRDLLLDRFEPGTVFLDVDASWNPTTQERAELLPQLRAGGVGTVMFLHDLLPQTHPQWFIPQLVEVSTAHVNAHLSAGSTFVCNSEHTRATLLEYARTLGFAAPMSSVVPMGAGEVPAVARSSATSDESPFFLVVGTIEPRKNHTTVLHAFEKVHTTHPEVRLVVVGRPGWQSDDVAARLRGAADQGVEWLDSASDDELDDLYARARAVVVASISEGFGLPVVEAFQRGAPVISSTGGALPEAAADLADLFEPYDVEGLYAHLVAALDDDHHAAALARVALFAPATWADTAAAIGDELRTAARR